MSVDQEFTDDNTFSGAVDMTGGTPTVQALEYSAATGTTSWKGDNGGSDERQPIPAAGVASGIRGIRSLWCGATGNGKAQGRGYAGQEKDAVCHHVAVIERSGPFAAADARLLEQERRRITNGCEFYRCMRWQHDRDVHIVHFAEAHQAKALESPSSPECDGEIPPA